MRRMLRSGWAALAATLLAAMLLLTAADLFPAPREATLTVFAAASLTDAFGELAHGFERAHPGVTVRLSFAGSQQLVAQLAAGARADVFAAADARSMDDAAKQGSLDGEARVFARNRLAVIVPATDPARIDRLDQLARSGIKLVLCAPNVPAGRYARELFTRLEQAALLPRGGAAKVLANVVSEEDNVRAVLGKVRLGEADAGVVYRSDLGAAPKNGPRELAVPDSLNPVAGYPIAVLRGAPSPDLARAFVEYACGAEGQRVLAEHGFLPAGAAASPR
jgi:molybdate transport system substrate-binding protein